MEQYQERLLCFMPIQHTVTVTAMGVTTTGTFTLEVITAPSITYPDSPFTLTKNTAVSGVTPVNTGGPIDLVNYWIITQWSKLQLCQRQNNWNAYFGHTDICNSYHYSNRT